jgi:hypothetical protein
MKLLLIIYSGSQSRLVPDLLEQHEAGGYTRLVQAQGAGETGRREGTRAWPGGAEVFFTVVPAGRAEQLTTALREESGRLDDGERLHAAVMPIETFF